MKCPWCIELKNENKCDENPDCDFRSLPMEKEAILERLKKEYVVYAEIKDRAMKETTKAGQEQVLRACIDKLYGMNRMGQVLERKFGMTKKQIQEEVGIKDISFNERAKMMLKLSKFGR